MGRQTCEDQRVVSGARGDGKIRVARSLDADLHPHVGILKALPAPSAQNFAVTRTP